MGDLLQIDSSNPDALAVERAAEVLRAGGVAVFPTDTVYGIAQSVDANPGGATGIFSIKRRDPSKTVAWLVADPSALAVYGHDLPPYVDSLARAFWPGALTLCVPASKLVVDPWRAPDGTVALRMPACEATLSIIRAVGCPLATSSANTSGMPAPGSFDRLEERVVASADIVLRGSVPAAGLASTVVVCDPDGPRFVREGSVAPSEVLEVAKRDIRRM